MTQSDIQSQQTQQPEFTANTGAPVFYRTYSQRKNGKRENWQDVVTRTTDGLTQLGQFSPEETALIRRMAQELKSLPSGRWLWVGGTDWILKPENFSGAYNCTSTKIIDLKAFGLMMDLAMMGSGTGAILEPRYINQLPPVKRRLNVTIEGEFGRMIFARENTKISGKGNKVLIEVGDSRQGWVQSYMALLELATDAGNFANDAELDVVVDISSVRKAGEPLKGFGGVANPIRLPAMYTQVAGILNKAVGRQLTSVECCLLIDEGATAVVAGNIRRCLPGDVLVETAKGMLPIKDIQVGDLVATPIGHKKVTEKFDQGVQTVLEISVADGSSLRSTANHKHAICTDSVIPLNQIPFTPDTWRAAGELKIGDYLIRKNALGRHESCQIVGINEVAEPIDTYDIEVEEAHCFYADRFLTHNSAGMRQGISSDEAFASAKENLWAQDENGNWRIDPDRDALRMANHTRVFHHQPTEEECINAVRKQFKSGEGAIQYAPEAIARSSADILSTPELKLEFLQQYLLGNAESWLQEKFPEMPAEEVKHRLERFGLNPCGEILGSNFHCNLSEVHLNQLDPFNYQEQEAAFTAAALSVAALLNHQFVEPRYQQSREFDPIVGVSFTGLFDFFVHAFGVDWLRWWEAGRPDTVAGIEFRQREQGYLTRWRELVHQVVWDYCDRQGLKRPNRCTTVQPAGTKSLLTGASPGWHPPKAQRFIRRITCSRGDAVAMAGMEYGYKVIPGQADKDDNGNLLNDPFDPRCTEWLLEIPVEVSWANLPGADEIAIEKFSALAQFDFFMQVQRYWTTHNTSATIEIREAEIEPFGSRVYQAIQENEGYISAALLARFDDHQTFPRMPFEPIDRATYEAEMIGVLQRRESNDFYASLLKFDQGFKLAEGPAGCDSDFCTLKGT